MFRNVPVPDFIDSLARREGLVKLTDLAVDCQHTFNRQLHVQCR